MVIKSISSKIGVVRAVVVVSDLRANVGRKILKLELMIQTVLSIFLIRIEIS